MYISKNARFPFLFDFNHRGWQYDFGSIRPRDDIPCACHHSSVPSLVCTSSNYQTRSTRRLPRHRGTGMSNSQFILMHLCWFNCVIDTARVTRFIYWLGDRGNERFRPGHVGTVSPGYRDHTKGVFCRILFSSVADVDQATQVAWLSPITWSLSSVLCKLSIVWQYRQIFLTKRFTLVCDILIVLLVSFGICAFFMCVFICVPVRSIWDVNVLPDFCLNREGVHYSINGFNVLMVRLIGLLFLVCGSCFNSPLRLLLIFGTGRRHICDALSTPFKFEYTKERETGPRFSLPTRWIVCALPCRCLFLLFASWSKWLSSVCITPIMRLNAFYHFLNTGDYYSLSPFSWLHGWTPINLK